MTFLDLTLPDKVYELVEKYGKEVSFTSEVKTFDATTGATTSTATVYKRKVTPPEEFDSKYIDNDTVRLGDMQITLAAKGLKFTPIESMKVLIDAKSFNIVAIRKIYTGELIGAYTVQLRG